MKVLDIIVTSLLIIGAINWGLVGFFGFNLVGMLFGEATAISRVIYAFVRLSGLYEVYNVTFGYNEMHHRWCDMTEVRH